MFARWGLNDIEVGKYLTSRNLFMLNQPAIDAVRCEFADSCPEYHLIHGAWTVARTAVNAFVQKMNERAATIPAPAAPLEIKKPHSGTGYDLPTSEMVVPL